MEIAKGLCFIWWIKIVPVLLLWGDVEYFPCSFNQFCLMISKAFWPFKSNNKCFSERTRWSTFFYLANSVWSFLICWRDIVKGPYKLHKKHDKNMNFRNERSSDRCSLEKKVQVCSIKVGIIESLFSKNYFINIRHYFLVIVFGLYINVNLLITSLWGRLETYLIRLHSSFFARILIKYLFFALFIIFLIRILKGKKIKIMIMVTLDPNEQKKCQKTGKHYQHIQSVIS